MGGLRVEARRRWVSVKKRVFFVDANVKKAVAENMFYRCKTLTYFNVSGARGISIKAARAALALRWAR